MKKILMFFFFIFSITFAQNSKVLLGIDVLQKDNFSLLSGKRIGLITNQTGVNSKLESTLDLFKNANNFDLVAVFSPEHGLKGHFGAGEKFDDKLDSTNGITYYSLYGKTRKPTKEMLQSVDALVYDIQDIGCRSYTYISTMGLAMEAAAENNIEFIVLDRPNPLGGKRVEGNLVEDGFESFVSKFRIPYVYGLTCGELARFLNEEGMLSNGVRCKLNIVKMDGWNRNMKFEDTGLIWVPTSSHVPYPEIPFYLVGTGVLGELVTIAIGISYTLPFQTFAAEWINADTLASKMNALNLPGVIFRPIVFKTNYGLWLDKILSGVQIHISDYDKAELLPLQFYFMQVNNELYPDKNIFAMSDSSRIKMFDKVMGTDKIRNLFSKRFRFEDIQDILKRDVDSFKSLSKKYYLYD